VRTIRVFPIFEGWLLFFGLVSYSNRHVHVHIVRGSFVISTTDTDKGCIAAKSVSTYPMLMNKATGKAQRHGDPNADAFYATLDDNRAILAIADGCSWGLRSYKASRSALEGVSQYLLAHEDQMTDLRNAGRLLLRSLSEANRKILEGVSSAYEAGTTTVLVGIVLQVASEEEGEEGSGGD
jgi:hypothetical protein